MFTKPGRTQSEQAEAHGNACLEYAREALAAGNPNEAEAQVNAAENWFRAARNMNGEGR